MINIKGTVQRDFRHWIMFLISFPPAPEYPIRTGANFQKFAAQGAPPVDIGGEWKKSSIIKVLIIYLDTFG
jgi:hypothetical protein